MKRLIMILAAASLVLTAASALAADADLAGAPDGFVIAQAPPPGYPPPSGASPKARHQLNCNVRQANCANICNTRYYGAARNACYNRCNAEYIRCTQKTNRLPAY